MTSLRELQIKLHKLEIKLDTLEIDDPEFSRINDQANDVADQISRIETEQEYRDAKAHIVNKELAYSKRLAELTARVTITHGSYDKWYKWAMSLYTITEDFTVLSAARNWHIDVSWQFDNYMSCLEKIEQLIQYKEYDRGRGRGNKELDVAGFSSEG